MGYKLKLGKSTILFLTVLMGTVHAAYWEVCDANECIFSEANPGESYLEFINRYFDDSSQRFTCTANTFSDNCYFVVSTVETTADSSQLSDSLESFCEKNNAYICDSYGQVSSKGNTNLSILDSGLISEDDFLEILEYSEVNQAIFDCIAENPDNNDVCIDLTIQLFDDEMIDLMEGCSLNFNYSSRCKEVTSEGLSNFNLLTMRCAMKPDHSPDCQKLGEDFLGSLVRSFGEGKAAVILAKEQNRMDMESTVSCVNGKEIDEAGCTKLLPANVISAIKKAYQEREENEKDNRK